MRRFIIWAAGIVIFVVMMAGTLLDYSKSTEDSRSIPVTSIKKYLNILGELHSEDAKADGIYNSAFVSRVNMDNFIRNGKTQITRYEELIKKAEKVFISSKYTACRDAVYESKVLWKYKYEYILYAFEVASSGEKSASGYSLQEDIYKSQKAYNTLLASCLYDIEREI